MERLPTLEIIVNKEKCVSASVIWLHGLGADGHDFAPIVPQLSLPGDFGIRFIFPHAPSRAVTINGGYVMPAWYDIVSADIERVVDEAQLRKSAEQIVLIIEQEIARSVPSQRIVLAGFSQGGAVVYEAALGYGKSLAGLLVMSSYFATQNSIQRHSANTRLPILIQHGINDSVVPEVLGQAAYRILCEQHYPVEYQHYVMDHSVCPAQITNISLWLKAILGNEVSLNR